MVVTDEKENNSQGLDTMPATAKTPKIQSAPIESFYLNPDNVRGIENYDVAQMISKIAALGRAIVPVFALPADTEGEMKGKRQTMDGNRRIKALQIIALRAKALAEGKQENFDASVGTIEGAQSKAMADAAKAFDYSAIDLNVSFIEISKEQAEDEKEMLKLQLITGTSAKALTPSEYAEGVLKLLAEYDGNEAATAQALGNDKVWIQKIARVYVGINKDDRLLSAIEEGRIDVDLGDQIGAFARKHEIPIASAVDEVLAAAGTRGKAKATKKDLDSVKAVHSPKPQDPNAGSGGSGDSGDAGNSGGSGDSGSGDTPKPIKARKDCTDIFSEFIKFATQQLQADFSSYSDETLSSLAIRANSLHNLMIRVEESKPEPETIAADPVEIPETSPQVLEPVIAQ